MPAPQPVKEPHKELRFTRGRFAMLAGAFGLVSLIAVILILYVNIHLWFRDGELPPTPAWWWCLPASLGFVFASRLAILFSRHAYLLLTPLGVEILPLFRPAKRMRAIFWPELRDLNKSGQLLTFHLESEATPQLRISIVGLATRQQALLMMALQGRLDRRNNQS